MHHRNKLLIVLAIPRLVQTELLVQPVLLNERQSKDPPAQQRLAVLVGAVGWGEVLEGVVVSVNRDGQLLQVVR